MLFLIIFLMTVNVSWGKTQLLTEVPQKLSINVNHKCSELPQVSRTFEGRVEKTGWFFSCFSKYPYRLYNKDKCIALLDFQENLRTPKIIDCFLGKNVIIKGIPQYINREPYLVISIDDICEKK